MTESGGLSREGTQGRHQSDFKPATDGISVYFNINDPHGKAVSKPPTGAPAPLESGKTSFNTPAAPPGNQRLQTGRMKAQRRGQDTEGEFESHTSLANKYF